MRLILYKTIGYFIDVQKRAKFLGVISSHAQIPKPIFFSYVHITTGKGGYFFSRTENTVIIFHLVSIVKYNNIQYDMHYYYTLL